MELLTFLVFEVKKPLYLNRIVLTQEFPSSADCRTLVAGVCCFYGDVDLRALIPPVQGDGLVEWYHEV